MSKGLTSLKLNQQEEYSEFVDYVSALSKLLKNNNKMFCSLSRPKILNLDHSGSFFCCEKSTHKSNFVKTLKVLNEENTLLDICWDCAFVEIKKNVVVSTKTKIVKVTRTQISTIGSIRNIQNPPTSFSKSFKTFCKFVAEHKTITGTCFDEIQFIDEKKMLLEHANADSTFELGSFLLDDFLQILRSYFLFHNIKDKCLTSGCHTDVLINVNQDNSKKHIGDNTIRSENNKELITRYAKVWEITSETKHIFVPIVYAKHWILFHFNLNDSTAICYDSIISDSRNIIQNNDIYFKRILEVFRILNIKSNFNFIPHENNPQQPAGSKFCGAFVVYNLLKSLFPQLPLSVDDVTNFNIYYMIAYCKLFKAVPF
jgi:hypothetical protein